MSVFLQVRSWFCICHYESRRIEIYKYQIFNCSWNRTSNVSGRLDSGYLPTFSHFFELSTWQKILEISPKYWPISSNGLRLTFSSNLDRVDPLWRRRVPCPCCLSPAAIRSLIGGANFPWIRQTRFTCQRFYICQIFFSAFQKQPMFCSFTCQKILTKQKLSITKAFQNEFFWLI